MRKLISQSKFAGRTGYSRARISQLVQQGVIILQSGKVDPDQAINRIREKVFRPHRLEKLDRLSKPTPGCDECNDHEQQSVPETFFCKRLNLTITRGKGGSGNEESSRESPGRTG